MATLARPLGATSAQCQAEQYIALRDERAPYRGRWLICGDGAGQFWAIHDAAMEPDQSAVDDKRLFSACHEASRFMRHLLLHGWSIYGQSQGDLLDQLW